MSHIVFRTDVSLEIGIGHFMRCFNLASVLKLRGADVTFITNGLPGFLATLLEQKQIKNFQLKATSPQEFDQIFKTLDRKPEWLVVDHYQLDERWEKVLRPWVQNIAVIDDLANRRHDCDLLIDPNLYDDGGTIYRPLVPSWCNLLIGPRFVLLSPEFVRTRKAMQPRSEHVQEILVSFGGSDPTYQIEKVIKAIKGLSGFMGTVNVVVGKLNPRIHEIENQLNGIRNAKLYVQTERMAELMESADLAIGAGGTELWERCCLGLPSIVIATAENQKRQLEALAKKGLIFYLGPHDNIKGDEVVKTVEVLQRNVYWLKQARISSQELVDGRGANRVASWLLKHNLKVQKAVQRDEERIFQWRNAPEVRKHSFDRSPILKEEHKVWFKNTLASKDRTLLIVEDKGEAIAVLRYDLVKTEAVVSIYVVPGYYGRGYGPTVLQAGNEWLAQEHPEIEVVVGKILSSNQISERAFSEAGFQYHHADFRKNVKTLFLNYDLKNQSSNRQRRTVSRLSV